MHFNKLRPHSVPTPFDPTALFISVQNPPDTNRCHRTIDIRYFGSITLTTWRIYSKYLNWDFSPKRFSCLWAPQDAPGFSPNFIPIPRNGTGGGLSWRRFRVSFSLAKQRSQLLGEVYAMLFSRGPQLPEDSRIYWLGPKCRGGASVRHRLQYVASSCELDAHRRNFNNSCSQSDYKNTLLELSSLVVLNLILIL